MKYHMPVCSVSSRQGTGRNLTGIRIPNHREKVDLQLESLSVLVSQTPRFIQEGTYIVKLSKEDPARHWMGVSQVMG